MNIAQYPITQYQYCANPKNNSVFSKFMTKTWWCTFCHSICCYWSLCWLHSLLCYNHILETAVSSFIHVVVDGFRKDIRSKLLLNQKSPSLPVVITKPLNSECTMLTAAMKTVGSVVVRVSDSWSTALKFNSWPCTAGLLLGWSPRSTQSSIPLE